METYSFLRELADSWVLLALVIFYLGTIVWAFRPGSRAVHDDIADIPFRNEDAPKQKKSCKGTCASCTCKSIQDLLPKESA